MFVFRDSSAKSVFVEHPSMGGTISGKVLARQKGLAAVKESDKILCKYCCCFLEILPRNATRGRFAICLMTNAGLQGSCTTHQR